MAQTNYTPISLYYSATASATPTAGNLVAGELALNTNDGKLFYKDSSGVVQTLASKAGNVNVSSFSAGSTGLTPNTATTGAVTLGGTLNVSSGGTGLNSLTSGYIPYGNGTSAFGSSANLFWDSANNRLGVGTSSPSYLLDVTGTINAGGANPILYVNNGTITYRVIPTAGALYTGTTSNHDYIFQTNNGEKMRITAGGNIYTASGVNVGIGTSSPSYLLDVYSTTGATVSRINNNNASGYAQLYLTNSGTSGRDYILSVGGSSAGAGFANNFYIYDTVASATRLTLDSSGNLGLGVTPSGWYTANSFHAVQLSNGASFHGQLAGGTYFTGLSSNFYANSSGADTYIVSGYASQYRQWNGVHSWQIAPSGSVGGPITFTQAMTLDNSGRLLLGTTTAASAAGVAMVMTNGTSGGIEMCAVNNGGGVILPIQTGGMQFYTFTGAVGSESYSERARIDSSGTLLVGTTSNPITSTCKFVVYGGTAEYATAIYNSSATNPFGTVIRYSAAAPNGTGNQFLDCIDTGATRAQIRSNGGIANITANNVNLSDIRTKTDINLAGSYLDKICAIPVKTFKYKDQTDNELNLGVIAQDVEAVAPELVDTSGFGKTPENGIPLKAIYQTDLIYALMKAIQEQQAIIEQLKAKVGI